MLPARGGGGARWEEDGGGLGGEEMVTAGLIWAPGEKRLLTQEKLGTVELEMGKGNYVWDWAGNRTWDLEVLVVLIWGDPKGWLKGVVSGTPEMILFWECGEIYALVFAIWVGSFILIP